MLPRKQYVNELMRLKENGRVKIITGLRRRSCSGTDYRDTVG